MKGAEKHIVEAETEFQRFQAVRNKVDENLGKPVTARDSELLETFVPTVTHLIEIAAIELRLRLETLTTPPTAALSQLVAIRHLAAQMAENAGRERAFLAGTIGAHAKIGGDGVRRIAR